MRKNQLIIADTHEPFCLPDYLEFTKDVQRKYNCDDHVIHIGDEVDNHALSYHEKDANGKAIYAEMDDAMKRLLKWYKAYPNVTVCVGNHSALPFRQANTAGIPARWLKTYKEVWSAPKGWKWVLEVIIDDVLYEHGTGASGKNAALSRAEKHRMRTVIGHTHTNAGAQFNASRKDLIWGLNVGAGIDHRAYAFAYAKENAAKPVIGCGVVAEGGRVPIFVPMAL
jgi:predicted phosphodiesterase